MKTIRTRLMELAGIPIKENTAADVIAAIAKNKAALTAAISKRLKNDEDTSAYEAVESLIIKTAIEAGVPKKYAEDFPWMEAYAVPGESTVKDDLERLKEDLTDMIENPDGSNQPDNSNQPDSRGLSPKDTEKILMRAATQGIYVLGLGNRDAIRKRMEAAKSKMDNWNYADSIVVKDKEDVYIIFLPTFPNKNTAPVGIVRVKNNNIEEDVYLNKGPLSQDPTAIGIRDVLVAKLKTAGLESSIVRSELNLHKDVNPALNGKVKVPECSQIQSELKSELNIVGESLHEQLLRAAKNKLQTK